MQTEHFQYYKIVNYHKKLLQNHSLFYIHPYISGTILVCKSYFCTKKEKQSLIFTDNI